MKKTWMLSHNFYKPPFDKFNKFFFYINFFIKYFNILFFNKNSVVFLSFWSLIRKIFYYQSLFFLTNKFFNDKYNNLNIKLKLDTFKINSIQNNKIFKNCLNIKNSIEMNTKLINLFFLFNYSMFNAFFKNHHIFNFFYIKNKNSSIIILNVKKLMNRWRDALDLFYNIFYFNYNPLIFSSPLFKNEILALNWNYNKWNINIWKYSFPFFIFKPNTYSNKIDFFFEKLKFLNINFFFVTDCFYHFKNLFYFKKHNYFTVGLTQINNNPWTVSYPILSFFNNYLIQFFFLKILIYINKTAVLNKYHKFKFIWFQQTSLNLLK
jgi:hypothetical protein